MSLQLRIDDEVLERVGLPSEMLVYALMRLSDAPERPKTQDELEAWLRDTRERYITTKAIEA